MTTIWAGSAENLNLVMSQRYLTLAKDAFEQSRYDIFDQNMQLAKEFDANLPDYHVLMALSLIRQELYGAALQHYLIAEKNLLKEQLYTQAEIKEAIYPLLYRTKNYQMLLARYRAATYSVSADQYFYTLLAMRMMGDKSGLPEVFKKASRAYPYDARFYVALFDLDNFEQDYYKTLRYLAYRATNVASDKKLSALDQSIVLAMIKRIDDEQLRRQILEESFVWLCYDQNYQAEIRLQQLTVPAAMALLFQEPFYVDTDYIPFAKVSDGYVRKQYMGHDTDKDGIPDQYGYIYNGKGFWAYDPDQTGAARYELQIKDNSVVGLIERRGDTELHWQFDLYPVATRVDVLLPHEYGNASGWRFIYHLMPNAMVLDHAQLKRVEDWTTLTEVISQLAMPSLRQISDAAWQVDHYVKEKLTRRMQMTDSNDFKIYSDTSGNGQFDHLAVYKNGEVAYGARDMDGDGRFDVYERYQDSKLQSLVYYASAANRLPSYIEDYYKNGILKVQIWLFDMKEYVSTYALYRSNGQLVAVDTKLETNMTAEELIRWQGLNDNAQL